MREREREREREGERQKYGVREGGENGRLSERRGRENRG